MKEKVFRRGDVLAMFGVGRTTLHSWLTNDLFPRPVKIGGTNYWLDSDLDKWIDAQVKVRDESLQEAEQV
ncbi:helix-turn-helix transcriptional regulator [Desulfogranum marinum]|uniref:helix-turn-helix transcriptional regulator n=1 Tax=Desulfogranum marinum TaxID=453220 RepID=UPI001965B95B|nr:AlpA family phage regulatory protein [Desulfogranum marinum]